MSDTEESDCSDTGIGESLKTIHQHVEQLAHLSKHIYTRALRVHTLSENPDIDIWAESFKIHERAARWAKKHMVASKCSLWQVHETLLEDAKKEGRIHGETLRLNATEAEILDLPEGDTPIWTVLGRLPRFFI
jgi:hypothetical protein